MRFVNLPLSVFAASEYVLNSNVFGSNYQLPLIGLSCGSGASHISECQFHNQTSNCNHKRTAGIICKGILISVTIHMLYIGISIIVLYIHQVECMVIIHD